MSTPTTTPVSASPTIFPQAAIKEKEKEAVQPALKNQEVPAASLDGTANTNASPAAASDEAPAADELPLAEMAKDWWRRYSKTVLEAATAVKEESDMVRDRTRKYVRGEPVKALLIAAALGVLVGGGIMLASRGNNRRTGEPADGAGR